MTTQVNSVKLDELIEQCEFYLTNVDRESIVHKISLAALKAHKAGYKMCEKDGMIFTTNPPSYSGWTRVETELSKLLEGLE